MSQSPQGLPTGDPEMIKHVLISESVTLGFSGESP